MSRRLRAARPAGPLAPSATTSDSTATDSDVPTSGAAPAPSRRAVRSGLAGLVAAAIALGLVTIGSPAAVARPAATSTATATNSTVLATTAGGFTDSVGVNTHTAYGQTAYGDTGRVVSLLQTLGVRHVRDALTGVKQQVNALSMLGAAGIHDDALIGASSMTNTTVPAAKLAEARQLAPYLDSIEPTNEADCTGDSNWVGHLHTYSHNLATAVRGDSTLAPVPLLGPAFCRPESVAQYGSAAADSDIANAHDYSRGQIPELAFESRLPGFSSVQNPGKPQVVTEFGFHDAGAAKGDPPTVTQATAADYDVRALLDGKRLGLKRTYIYELMDEQAPTDTSEEYYGLVNSDGTVKPAFTAVADLLSDIDAGNPAATAGTPATAQVPAVTVNGGGSLLRSLQIGDTDGNGQTVALWLDTPLDNLDTQTRLPDDNTTVNLQIPGGATATAEQPSRGNAVSSLGSGTSFQVPVDGAVTLVHLDTSSASSSTAASTTSCPPDYAALAGQLGATEGDNLSAGTGWTGSPGAASVPSTGAAGAEINASGETTHVSVPGSSTAWTIAMWERTDASSAQMADFLHVTNAHGAKFRTYNLVDDVPSHDQISAIGLPQGTASYGTGVMANAMVGSWHLVSLAEDGSNATFSVDGISAGSVPSTGASLAQGIDIGALSSGFRGSLGGLEVFPTALNEAQLVTLATAAPSTCSSGGSTGGSSGSNRSSTVQVASHLSSYVPQQVYKGHSATLITRLMSPTGALAGETLQLEARAVGSTSWTQVTSQVTGSDGTIRFAVSPTVDTDYQWTYAGSTAYAASTSDTNRMTVLVYGGKAVK